MSTTASSGSVPGEVAAALVASAIGSLLLGFVVVLAEASSAFSDRLSIYPPTGSLSGKVAITMAGWLLAWAILHAKWRRAEIPSGRVVRCVVILVGLAFLGTFPPFFYLFG